MIVAILTAGLEYNILMLSGNEVEGRRRRNAVQDGMTISVGHFCGEPYACDILQWD